MTQEHTDHDAKVRDYFDERVAAYDFYDPPSRLTRTFNHIFRRAVYARRDHTLVLAKRYGCRTILDVGCGGGQNSVWFARDGIDHVFGLDISAEMIAQATALAERAGVADKCEFKHADFMSMPTGQKYDMVVALGVFDYVRESEAFLRHMAAFADRVVYGSFPGWTLVRTPLRKIRYTLRGCPTHFYRRREVEHLLESVGFGRADILPMPSGCLGWISRERPGAETNAT